MLTKIKNVAIISLGLIGGSLGMTIKNKELAEKVIGISRSEETIKEAKKKGAIDEGTTDKIKGVAEADLIFVCSPINIIVETIKEIIPHVKKGCIITDVGSTKVQIVSEVEKILPEGIYFVGGHPMAGSERSGLSAASPFLFEGAKYILTSTENTNKEALETLKTFLTNLEVEILVLNPDIHDILVAGVSHLPIAVAVSLVNTINDMLEYKEQMLNIAASGFRDTTRIASSSVEMDRDIFMSNREKLLKMIDAFKSSLSRLEALIRMEDAEGLQQELERAKKLRDGMYSL